VRGKRDELKRIAYRHLAGVGDMSREWHEWTGYAFHLRRRLTAAEQAAVGSAVDLRGTAEGRGRFDAIKASLPYHGMALAMQELGENRP
jgi:hypothetical protein